MEGADEQATGGVTMASSTSEGNAGAGKGEGAAVSEYTKWMDGAEKALQEAGVHDGTEEMAPGEEAEAEEEVTATADQLAAAESGDKEGNFVARQWRKISQSVGRAWRGIWGPKRSRTERALDEAEKAQKDARRRVQDNKARTRELQSKVGGMVDEDKLAFSGLDGRCISKKFGEYNYEVCFFTAAKQDSVSIGRWREWEQPGVALFDGGQYCPGGPERSLRVRFSCASKEELLEVSEPSRCAYAAMLAHPGACTQTLLDRLMANQARLPTDEL
mmetsp:Transcript_6701/g.21429  ORF Transcript_6701/g.21429 Transcript_6701/m.21429 type:complete len:274 (+) Transcript_6701:342-1163(+)